MPARGKTNRGHANFLQHGTNNVIDDRTGFKLKGTDCSFEWNMLFVWDQVWEERHPMDLLRGFPDFQNPKVSRPDTQDVFLSPDEVTGDDL